MIELKIEMYERELNELKPYYDRFSAIEAKQGKEPHTFEEYLVMVLTLGCRGFMLGNAERLESSAKAYYKQKEGEKIDKQKV